MPTKLHFNSKPVMRELAEFGRRDTPYVVGITATGVVIGEKGWRRSSYYEVPAEALYALGARLKAKQADIDKQRCVKSKRLRTALNRKDW